MAESIKAISIIYLANGLFVKIVHVRGQIHFFEGVNDYKSSVYLF
jgi:hypothetical protein